MGRMAEEINAGCESGRIRCGPTRSGITPPITFGTIGEALTHFPAALAAMTGSQTTIQAGRSFAEPRDLVRAALLYGRVAPPPPDASPAIVRVSGWVANLGSLPAVSVRDPAGAEVMTQITGSRASDVEEFFLRNGFGGYAATRFDVQAGCRSCVLTVTAFETADRGVALQDLTLGRVIDEPGLVIHIDAIESAGADADLLLAIASSNPDLLAAMEVIRAGYAATAPPLVVLAGLGTLGAASIRQVRRRHAALVVLSIAFAVAALARMFLIALIEVTSWPGAVHEGYLLPASPLILGFAVLGTYLTAAVVANLHGRARRQWAGRVSATRT